MPRFFFHVYDGKVIPDHKGAELPDWEAARLNAIAVAGRLLTDEPERIALGEDWRMEVKDEEGLILFQLNFFVAASPALRSDRLKEEGSG